jgi:hypothetical protein
MEWECMTDTVTVILSGLSSGFGIVVAQILFRWLENQQFVRLIKKKTERLVTIDDKQV